MSSQELAIFTLKAFFSVAVVIALVLFVLLPLWRHLRTGPDLDLFDPMSRLPEEEFDELEIPSGGEGEKPDRAAIISQAKQDPRVTANMVSNWLKQKN